MPCAPKARQRARECAEVLGAYPAVHDADVLSPEADRTDCWAVELTLRRSERGLGPQLLDEIAARGLTVRECQPRGTHWDCLLTV